jgi:hypothetical protein
MENKKYFVAADSYYMKDYIEVKNIRYAFCSKSLKDAPVSNLNFDSNFSNEFFKHICFYEIYFNEKEQPVRLHNLTKQEDDIEFANGWLDYNDYIYNNEYNKWFIFKGSEKGVYFDSNSELFEAMLDWKREQAIYYIKDRIIDSIMDEEYDN